MLSLKKILFRIQYFQAVHLTGHQKRTCFYVSVSGKQLSHLCSYEMTASLCFFYTIIFKDVCIILCLFGFIPSRTCRRDYLRSGLGFSVDHSGGAGKHCWTRWIIILLDLDFLFFPNSTYFLPTTTGLIRVQNKVIIIVSG